MGKSVIADHEGKKYLLLFHLNKVDSHMSFLVFVDCVGDSILLIKVGGSCLLANLGLSSF